jgi:hypothetical protein
VTISVQQACLFYNVTLLHPGSETIMSFAPSSPITGGSQTGLTSPTYTILADTSPANNAKQYYVSALGGTQTGVLAHSVAAPFTLSFWKPQVLRTLKPVNPVTGVLKEVPTNPYLGSRALPY